MIFVVHKMNIYVAHRSLSSFVFRDIFRPICVERKLLYFSPSLSRKQSAMASETPQDISIDPKEYPQARRDDSIVDILHGHKIADPYRWLEEPDAKETKDFVNDLNRLSKPFLNASKIRDKLREKLTKLWDYEKFGCTSIHGSFFYYNYNSGLQNQWVYYQQRTLGEKGKVFLDVNGLSKDGTTSISQKAWSSDGSMFAYGLSEKGSDWVTVKFRKNTGEDLPDEITHIKHSGLDWISTNEGVFYSKYPEHKGATEGSSTEKHKFHSLYYHKLGTNCKDDVLVADFRNDENLMCDGNVTEDGKYLIVGVSKGCDPTNKLYFYDLKAANNKIDGKLSLTPLFTKFDAKYDFIDNEGETALVMTNLNSPMFKLIRVKMNSADNPSEWETVIEEDLKRKLEWVAPVAGDKLVVCYLEDVKTALYVHELSTGKMLYQVDLGIGSVTGFYGRKDQSQIFIGFESFIVPTVIYHADFSKLSSSSDPIKLTEIKKTKISGLDTNSFEVKQEFFTSKDGTKCPMFILHKKDVMLDGKNPTLLNGYGGFNISDTPYFSLSRVLILNSFCGVVAVANLRGGGEYGEKWHEGGMRENKQNVFDDFISAAEYLITNKWTCPQKLAIHGGSNGGLLVAACSQQRPDLYGAVLNRVGVLDMLRFHKFTIGGAWVPEYGNPDDVKDFEFINKYSPLHNLRITKGVQWPSTLLMSADHDDRVVPLHTLKYVAQLYHLLKTEAADWQRNPILARIEVSAGHGSGKPTGKVIAEIVDMYCFLQRVLGMKWKE